MDTVPNTQNDSTSIQIAKTNNDTLQTFIQKTPEFFLIVIVQSDSVLTWRMELIVIVQSDYVFEE